MIGKINQIKSGTSIEFEILVENQVLFYAKQPAFDINTPMEVEDKRALNLLDTKGKVIFSSKYNVIENIVEEFIPFKFLITSGQRFNKYEVVSGTTHIGSFYRQVENMIEKKYHIEYENKIYLVREISVGRIRVLVIFDGDKQIAQITKPLVVTNNLDEYCIHILDDYNYFFKIVSFFTIYYDYQEFRNAGEYVLKAKSLSIEYSFSKIRDGYNANWILDNFGNDVANDLEIIINKAFGFWTPKKIIILTLTFIIGVFTLVGFGFFLLHK